MRTPAAAVAAESYRRLADVFHHLLSEQSLEALLETVANTLGDLVPYEALHVYEADETARELVPVLLRSEWAAEIFASRPKFGQGITGWAVEHREPVLANQAQLDPRVFQIPGTPLEPESLITVPLIARGSLKGALSIYRIGADKHFDDEEFELAKRFGDAAALALDNAQIRARLEHQAQTDSLTNLYNHRHYHERLRAELTRASRAGDTVAVLMLDIDHFKKVNDVYGHGVGDELLIALSDVTRTSVRAYDVVCRLGGEEFAVIMPSCTAVDAEGLAKRLVERVEETVFGAAGTITLSIGIAQGPLHAMSPRELTACAEAAMMTVKARGGDGVVVFSDESGERPEADGTGRDARSIAHLKMLQSLAGTLNRLNDVRAIGAAIVAELRLPQLPRVDRRRRSRRPDRLPRALLDRERAGYLRAARDPRRRRHHRPGRRDRRVAADHERARVRVRAPGSGHRAARGVAHLRAAALRPTRHRHDRRLEARRRPVRRRRPPPARGARRARVGRTRECTPLGS
jgi:diguanylate cyclase (GGDEF)-like protein